jgi:hypothetical protein
MVSGLKRVSWWQDRSANLLACMWLAAFFGKWSDLASWEGTVSAYWEAAPTGMAILAARVWLVLEIILSLGLWLRHLKYFCLIWTLILLIIATVALVLMPGPTCGCFGAWMPQNLQSMPGSLIRNLFFIFATFFALKKNPD